ELLPLHPQKQTSLGTVMMSGDCQQTSSALPAFFPGLYRRYRPFLMGNDRVCRCGISGPGRKDESSRCAARASEEKAFAKPHPRNSRDSETRGSNEWAKWADRSEYWLAQYRKLN